MGAADLFAALWEELRVFAVPLPLLQRHRAARGLPAPAHRAHQEARDIRPRPVPARRRENGRGKYMKK